MRVLVLGGTKFLGRALVDAALGRGHNVTLFNRGLTNPGLFPGLETIHGDRMSDVGVLSGMDFDVVFDVAAMAPSEVTPTVEALKGSVERYVFVSTVSVYADHSVPQVEGQLVLRPIEGQDPGEAYGAHKAAAEVVVADAFGSRGLVVWPGLIVGPHDRTDRFAYWPRRMARGGRVLAPGGPDHPAQFIDVRDLASWMMHAAEQRLGGTFNATGLPTTLGDLLETCRVIVGASSTLVWVSDQELLDAGISPWMGIPLRINTQGWEGHGAVDVTKARAAGLLFRPLEDTVRDVLAWDLARGGPASGPEGLSAHRERELLDTLRPASPVPPGRALPLDGALGI